MTWEFATVAGPFEGALGGLAWDGRGMLFSAVGEQRLLRHLPDTGAVEELRKYTNGVNGIALNDPANTLQLYQTMRSASEAVFDLQRDDQPLTISVTLDSDQAGQ